MTHPTKTAHQRAMGLRLRLVRETLGLTQAQFGEAANVGATTVAGWESGRNMMDLVNLAWAADLLGFSIDYVARNDLGGLRHDFAVRLQARIRASAVPEPKRRGRPPKSIPEFPATSPSPLVRAVPDDSPPIRRKGLHDAPFESAANVKTRSV